MSYVALGLGDPVVALSHAKQMLALPNLSGGLQYIGRLYAAEAHVLLERIPEAMQMLNPDTIVDVSLTGKELCCLGGRGRKTHFNCCRSFF